MALNSSPYIRCYLWGPAASNHLRASPSSRCSKAPTILREGSYDAGADQSGADQSNATSTPKHVSAANIPSSCIPNGYAAQCVRQDRRASRLSCLRAKEYDTDRNCGREYQSVGLTFPSINLGFYFLARDLH